MYTWKIESSVRITRDFFYYIGDITACRWVYLGGEEMRWCGRGWTTEKLAVLFGVDVYIEPISIVTVSGGG